MITNVELPLASLKPHSRNYKKHPATQVDRIAQSLTTFGQPRSIVVWQNTILAGHGVVAAAKALGWATIRADVLPDDYPPEKAQAYVVADNELSRLADPDQVALAALLQEAQAFDATLLTAMGYDQKELDELLASVTPAGTGDAEPQTDRAEELRQVWGVEPGQLWALGEHRLICGDCTDAAVVARVMGGEKAALMFADPPFERDYHSRGEKGSVEKSDTWGEICAAVNSFCLELPTWYVKAGWRDALDLCPLIRPQDFIVWAKKGFGLGGGDYRPQHEILLYRNTGAPCKAGADVGNVWDFAVPFRGRMLHVAETPTPLIEQAISFSSDLSDLVFDPFAGSGTTLIACQNLARRCRAIEISPAYVAVALQRFQDASGITPVKLG
jgi:hypothetical protein